jgi:hypothetical protein
MAFVLSGPARIIISIQLDACIWRRFDAVRGRQRGEDRAILAQDSKKDRRDE